MQQTREKILHTASKLFYQRGFQAVGIDMIVAESGVAKMTLYRHFASKDDLIAAYLERSNQQFWVWLDAAVAHVAAPKARLVAIFEAVGRVAISPECLGCTFQGAAAEFPALDHPGHQVALAHKQQVRRRLKDLAEQAGLRDSAALANQLLMLMDGAWVGARMFGSANPATDLSAAARSLIQAHE
ncbi:MAG: helix-turn-helix domain-containing protein [Roseiflexaceae bacterium]